MALQIIDSTTQAQRALTTAEQAEVRTGLGLGTAATTAATAYATAAQGAAADTAVQPSGLRTINGQSLIGTGDIAISGGGGDITAAQITDATAAGRAVLTAADAAAQRAALGLGTAATTAAGAYATAVQGGKADTALQPGVLPSGTTIPLAQVTGAGTAAAANTSAFATAAQGAKADTAIQPGVIPVGTTIPLTQVTGAGTAAAQSVAAFATSDQGAKADAAMPATADAIADVLEAAATGAPADLARIQASVSGDGVGPRLSASGNLISPGVGQNGRVVCDWSADLGALLITAGTGTAALDSGVLIDGRPALRYTPGAATETGVARYTPTNPCRIQDIRSIQIPVRHTAQVGTTVSGAGNATANIQIWLITSANKQFRLYLRDAGVISGGDTVYTWSPRETTDTYVLSGGAVWMQADGSTLCSAENETVTQFQVVHFSSVQSAAFPIWLGPVYVNRRASHGVVSLRFDKCTASQYSIAWPIMQQYGIKATLALLSNAINTPGYLTTAQIDEMVAGGCDVALHTHTTTKTNGYANATDWPSADLLAQDITAGAKILRTSGWRWAQGLLIEGFTGGYTTGDIVRQRLIRSAFNNAGMPVLSTMQGVSATYRQQNYIGPRIAGISQRRIQCQQTLAATTVVSAVTDGVAQAAADGTLMGILAHDFVANGATPTGNEIRAGDFETICAAIKSSGALSLPLGDVLRHMY